MVQFTVVSRERHGARKWRRQANYGFASTEALVPIVGAELARAALSMPLAFGERSGRYTLLAVLSPTAGRNMFVAPDGAWLGGYVPACLRAHPFCLLARPGANEAVLSVDEEGGLVPETSSAGEEFFDQAGNVTPALKAEFDFLTEAERSRKTTDRAVSALAGAGVVVPWRIAIESEPGEPALGGLHRIDEAALRALPDDAFLALRAASALPLAYAQLLSAGQLGLFERLARIRAQLPPPPAGPLPETLDHLFEMRYDGLIRFE